MAKYNDLTVGQSEACINRMGGLDNFLRFIGGQGKVVFETLLTLLKSDIKASARKRFVVADNFEKGKAGIYSLGSNFQKWFGDKVETNVPAATLSSYTLTCSSVDGPIKAELGENHETFLSWLFEKIEAQADGREGELLVNGYANIFYVDGRVVFAHWRAGRGWHVSARVVTYPDSWSVGRRVFSRNSVLVSSETLVQAQV
jgi:prepilin-type processing-associated H-X9-DG protein